MASGHNPWGMSQDSVLQWSEVGMRLAPLEKAVEAMAQMLEDGEWAEHVSTIHKHPLAARLESAITELHNDIHQSEAAQQAPAGATEMENLQRTAVGWQERALRAERNWAACRRWAIAGGAPVEKLGDDPDQPFHAASPTIEGEINV